MPDQRRIHAAGIALARPRLAVGESSVILMTPPLLSLLKHLLKVEGAAAE